VAWGFVPDVDANFPSPRHSRGERDSSHTVRPPIDCP
jgi:hypothetical protein